jgi:hypothetical protein
MILWTVGAANFVAVIPNTAESVCRIGAPLQEFHQMIMWTEERTGVTFTPAALPTPLLPV